MSSLNRQVRRMLLIVHLWLGLIAGLFIMAMGLSGFIIVFRPMLERLDAPKVTGGPGTGLTRLTAVEECLAAIRPGARMSRVTFPASPTDPLLVQAETSDKQRLQVFFDPASGRALGTKKQQVWLDWIVDFHQNLLLGKTGRALTGVIGAALLLLSLSGVVSWLSGRRDWKRALALPTMGPWRRIAYQAHRWTGLWTNVLLVAVSFTGIVLAYPDAFQRAIRTMAGETQRTNVRTQMDASTGRGTREKLRPLDDYVRAATAAVPGSAIRDLRLPGRGRSVLSISLWAPGDIRRKGGTIVLLDVSTARVASIERSSTSSLSRRLLELSNAIHKTELGGWPVKAAWSLLGLLPVLLFVSGFQIWWTRRQTASRAALRGGAGAASVEPNVLAER